MSQSAPAWHDPARTALIAGDAPAGAVAAGVFRVLVDFVESQGRRVGLDWSTTTLAPDEVRLRGDPAGAYFCARIDLLLRSYGIAA